MKKYYKVIFWICFVLTVFSAIVSATMDLGIEASKRDENLYHLGGFLMMIIISVGFFIETGIFNIKEKIKLHSMKKHIIVWLILISLSVVCFAICNGMTSQEFKDAMNAKSQIEEKSVQEESNIKVEEPFSTQTPSTEESVENPSSTNILESEVVDNTNQIVPEKPVETSIPQESKEESVLVVETSEPEEEQPTDIDGHIFTFDNAVYTVNGIEVTFYSVEFEKTDKLLNGYTVFFEYSAKNTSNEKATLKFSTINNQFRFNGKKAVLTTQAMNTLSDKYAQNLSLQAGEEHDKIKVMLTVTSDAFPNSYNGEDYPAVEIGDIMSDEPVEMDITITGWIGDNSETMKITFFIN